MTQLHALTFDVEDWHQGFLSRGIGGWENVPSREGATVDRLLDLLAGHGASATFFVLGSYAERAPETVRRILDAGHEVASHSHAHKPIPALTPAEFRDDLRRSVDVIGGITGARVRGYRATNWSLERSGWWALDILAEEGFEYDSSLFPTRLLNRHGVSGAPLQPHLLRLPSGRTIREFPAQVLTLGPCRLPAAGGFYLRALPGFVAAWALRQMEARGQPGMVYMHPYEIDAGIPRLGGPPAFRLMRYYGLAGTEAKLHRLLRRFRFGSIRQLLAGGVAAA